MTESKLLKVRAMLAVGDEYGALRLVKSFPVLGPEKETILRGWCARQSPLFYKQLGYDPDALWRDAVAAVRAKYNIEEKAMTEYDALADAGFAVAGTNEGGIEFYTRILPDGRVVVTGDEAKGAGVWGADVYPSEQDFLNGVNRTPFPGVYTDTRALVGAMRRVGLLPL
jgi:hypothetical protein